MKVAIITPVHDFIYDKLLSNINEQYKYDYTHIIVNDNSTKNINGIIKNKNDKTSIIYAPVTEKRNLKWSLSRVNEIITDIVHVVESDAVPSGDVFNKMFEAYYMLQGQGKCVASVSPMYTWRGKYCYPTHTHWHTDGEKNGYEISSNRIGKIANVGGAGVPFLYSLWNPKVFQYINQEKFPKFLHLDRDFGNFIYKKGFEHFRLLDCNIEHYGGGKKSW